MLTNSIMWAISTRDTSRPLGMWFGPVPSQVVYVDTRYHDRCTRTDTFHMSGGGELIFLAAREARQAYPLAGMRCMQSGVVMRRVRLFLQILPCSSPRPCHLMWGPFPLITSLPFPSLSSHSLR